jgi:hypothetical protein
MFFQEATPDTSGYMIAGYAIAFIVMALYVVSMYLRSRNLHQDMTMLEEMDKSAQRVVENRQPKKSKAKSTSNHKSTKPVTNRSRKN